MPILNLFFIISYCRMAQYQEDRRDEVLIKGEKLEKGGWEEYLKS